MLSFFFVLLPLVLTWLTVRRWFPKTGLLLAAGLTLLLPIIVLAWSSLVLSTFVTTTVAIQILVGLLLGMTVGIIRRSAFSSVSTQVRSLFQRVKYSIKHAWACWICIVILLPLFGYLLFTHSAAVKAGSWYSAGSSWGDLPLHLTYIHYFARQEKLSLVSPIFAQNQTTYPFLFDWYTSLLVRSGASVQTALIVSQWQALAALVLLALAVIRLIDRRATVTVLTMVLFFAGGGLGWWYFWGDWQASGLQLWEFLQHLPWQFTNMADRSVFFSNVIPDMLLPQRGFIIGLASCLAIISLYLHYIATQARRYFQLGCLLIGLLPLFHFHSFLWIGGLWFVISVVLVWRQPNTRRWVAKTIGLVCVLALPQLWWLAAHGVGDHFLRWQVGWMLTDNGWPGLAAFSWQLLINFGLSLVILLFLPTQLRQIARTSVDKSIIFGYSWLVFIVCLFISFQPWAYDNLKLMMVSFFFLCLFAALILSHWWKGWQKIVVVVLVVVSIASGTLSIIRESFLSSELAATDEVLAAKQLKMLLQPGAVTLTAGDHNHPIPMLVGQPIVMGYHGWLWSHGISTGETAVDVATMYAGSSNTQALLHKYGVRYVYISDRERSAYVVDENYWADHYEPVYRSNEKILYDVQARKN